MLTGLATRLVTPPAYQPLSSLPAPSPAPSSAPLPASSPTVSSAPLPALSSTSFSLQPDTAQDDDDPSPTNAPVIAADVSQQSEETESAAVARGPEEAGGTVQQASPQADRTQLVRGQAVTARPSEERVERPDALTSPAVVDRGETEAIGRDPRAAALAVWEAMRLDRLIEQISSAPDAPSLLRSDADQTAVQEKQPEPAASKYYQEF